MERKDHDPYRDNIYRKRRDAILSIIEKSAFLSAVNRNAGTINYALVTTAVAAIVSGILHVPVWGIAMLIVGAVAAAAVSAYAGYLDDRLSKTTHLDYSEARQTAEAKVNAKHLASALKVSLATERDESADVSEATGADVPNQSQPAITWKSRESNRRHTQAALSSSDPSEIATRPEVFLDSGHTATSSQGPRFL